MMMHENIAARPAASDRPVKNDPGLDPSGSTRAPEWYRPHAGFRECHAMMTSAAYRAGRSARTTVPTPAGWSSPWTTRPAGPWTCAATRTTRSRAGSSARRCQLPRPRLPPGPAAVPAAAGRPEGRRAVRAHLLGRGDRAPSRRGSGRSPPRPTGRRRSCRTATPARWASCMYGSLDRRFFHRLGASLLDRTICATAGAAGCDVTLGTRAVIDPEAVGPRPVHRQLGLEHRGHQHPLLGDRCTRPASAGRRSSPSTRTAAGPRRSRTGGSRSAPGPTRPWPSA